MPKAQGKMLTCMCVKCTLKDPNGQHVDSQVFKSHQRAQRLVPLRSAGSATPSMCPSHAPLSTITNLNLGPHAGPSKLGSDAPHSRSQLSSDSQMLPFSPDFEALDLSTLRDSDRMDFELPSPVPARAVTLVEVPDDDFLAAAKRRQKEPPLPPGVLILCPGDALLPGLPDGSACPPDAAVTYAGLDFDDDDAAGDCAGESTQPAPVPLRHDDSPSGTQIPGSNGGASIPPTRASSPVPTTSQVDYLVHPERLAFPGPYAPYTPRFPRTDNITRPVVYESTHPLWFIRVFQSLALILHVRHHVSFAALNLLLFTVRLVFVALGVLDPDAPINNFWSFTTVLSRFELKRDSFQKYPFCVLCHHLAPPNAPPGYVCPTCDVALFCNRKRTDRLFKRPLQPKRRVGIASLADQLAAALYDDDLQKKLEKHAERVRRPGRYRDSYDGRIMRTIRGVDGHLFFGPGPREKDELRIAMTMSIDAFKPHTTSFADNHSTTAISFAFSSLDAAERYLHMLVTSIIPGPQEPNAEQMQEHLVLPVDDLVHLYEHGIRVYSPAHPDGRLVRVVLIAVVCDHPALCRVCGFADKNHSNAPCTMCKIPQSDMKTPKAVRNQYELRDGAEHKRRAWEWRSLPLDQRDAYFKEHGVRWFELARLPYFDPVRMSVIDPMHCLLLGIVKTLWFEVWIKGQKALRANTDGGRSRELEFVHKLLDEFEAPAWLGRLPKHIGEPAGGNLSADEWRVLCDGYGPVVLPVLWWQLQGEADSEVHRGTANYKKKLRKYEKDERAAVADATSKVPEPQRAEVRAAALATFRADNSPPEAPSARPRRMQDEIPMFLSLSAALKLLLARSLSEEQRQRGKTLLLEHLDRFSTVYRGNYLKYNHHWCTHIPDEIIDFGPVYGFWTFPGERINKLIKSLNSNNHREGEMEISFLREFHRAQTAKRVLGRAARESTNPQEQFILSRLLADSRQARGTVETVQAEDGNAPATPESTEDTRDAAMEDEVALGQVRCAAPDKPCTLSTKQQAALAACYQSLGSSVHTAFDPRAYGPWSGGPLVFCAHHPCAPCATPVRKFQLSVRTRAQGRARRAQVSSGRAHPCASVRKSMVAVRKYAKAVRRYAEPVRMSRWTFINCVSIGITKEYEQ